MITLRKRRWRWERKHMGRAPSLRAGGAGHKAILTLEYEGPRESPSMPRGRAAGGGGAQGQVLESEKNVQKLQKDVNYVNTLIDQAKKKEPRGGQPSMMADEEEANLVQSLLIKGAVLAAIYFILTLIVPTPPPRV